MELAGPPGCQHLAWRPWPIERWGIERWGIQLCGIEHSARERIAYACRMSDRRCIPQSREDQAIAGPVVQDPHRIDAVGADQGRAAGDGSPRLISRRARVLPAWRH
jgi:hypothetical protein